MSEHKGEYALINVTEQIVKNLLPDMMSGTGGCTCERCIMDAMALALNSFNGNYITIKSSEDPEAAAESHISASDRKKIILSITKSIDFVKGNPRH